MELLYGHKSKSYVIQAARDIKYTLQAVVAT